LSTKPLSKRTKIVCTIGPASENEDTLKGMIEAGMDVVRLNFSHGTYESHAAIIARVRHLSEESKRPIAIMGDLRGPRIRIGEIAGGSVELADGQPYILTTRQIVGDARQAMVSYPGLPGDLSVGNRLLIDDGDIELAVERIEGPDIYCRVRDGGPLLSYKGINLPGISLQLKSPTEKDVQDVHFAVEQQLDFLALSFVQSADDVCRLKTLLAGLGAAIPVIAKIEKGGALSDLDAIIAEAYGIMVARGDLALEMSMAEVPIAQKTIISRCRALAVPVITATQMLESMVHEPRPTRAEASDVANAVLDGTDALMLSAETATGQHPVQAVATMAAIAARAEEAWRAGQVVCRQELPPQHSIDDTISYLSCLAARNLGAAAIFTHTVSGATARRVCRHRPMVPIIALTPEQSTLRRLSLSWGVRPFPVPKMEDTAEMGRVALAMAQQLGLAGPGEPIVITSGIPLGIPGSTNLLKVQIIPPADDRPLCNFPSEPPRHQVN
jgi:pyruvate kinase